MSTPPLAVGGLVIYGNFLKSRGGAEDFDKFCMNLTEKFSKKYKNSIKFFLSMYNFMATLVVISMYAYKLFAFS